MNFRWEPPGTLLKQHPAHDHEGKSDQDRPSDRVEEPAIYPAGDSPYIFLNVALYLEYFFDVLLNRPDPSPVLVGSIEQPAYVTPVFLLLLLQGLLPALQLGKPFLVFHEKPAIGKERISVFRFRPSPTRPIPRSL